jgi:excisionase family DNA binding protein
MKADALMSIKKLAELLGASTDTVRRAARRGEIPFTREGTAYRFDWEKVRQAMRARARKMPYRRSKADAAPAGNGRRRGLQLPPDGNTGALTTCLVAGGLSVR